MPEWELRDPWFLLAALLAPIVWKLASNATSVIAFSSLQTAKACPRSLRAMLSNLPAGLLALATVSLSVAMAGPRAPEATFKIRSEGIAIVMVMDVSWSMRARDLVQDDTSVNRLTVVKRVFKDFVLGGEAGRGRPDDAIGLVTFAMYADSRCPLTFDHPNLAAIVEDLDIDHPNESGRTAIGEGLALAVERLRNHKARSKVVLLLTDGENNAGDIDPEKAAELAKEHDIKVYCIGAGTNGIAPMPEYVRDRSGNIVPLTDRVTGQERLSPMKVTIDEKLLTKVADSTGGRYFRATDEDSLTDIYREIDELERTEIQENQYLRYRELYGLFVIAALSLIAAAGIASGSFLRRLP